MTGNRQDGLRTGAEAGDRPVDADHGGENCSAAAETLKIFFTGLHETGRRALCLYGSGMVLRQILKLTEENEGGGQTNQIDLAAC